jgi:hypothetical protein
MLLQHIGAQSYRSGAGAKFASLIATVRASLSGRWGDHLIRTSSILTLLAAWYVGAAYLPASVMPAPHVVARVLATEVSSFGIWNDVLITLTRIALAFSIAMSIALILGFAMGLSRTAERFFEIWIIGAITMPSLVLILTIYMVVGLNDRAAILGAALPVVPILTINIWEAIKGILPCGPVAHHCISHRAANCAGPAGLGPIRIGPDLEDGAVRRTARAQRRCRLQNRILLSVIQHERGDGLCAALRADHAVPRNRRARKA